MRFEVKKSRENHTCLLADVRQGNAQEALITAPTDSSPRVQFGCTVSQAFDGTNQVSTLV